jgi:2-polyprenyl-3-methyl-5-hydroxy-6-metoxy-1,4-benzoquinol methylase
MPLKDYHIVLDSEYGYRRLDPLPEDSELAEFYESQYYDLIRKGGRAPELRRLTSGGKEAAQERAWLQATLYADIEHILKRHAPGKRILDAGCGTGELVSFLTNAGFDTMGIEPSSEAVSIAQSSGLRVQKASLEEFSKYVLENSVQPFDVVSLLNVLEHVPYPVRTIELSRGIISSNGIICIRVPNDFTEIQETAREKIGCPPWWLAIPDHINYFDTHSIESLLNNMGFEVLYKQTDFPMEFFLLMGDEYVGNPEVGNRCHQKRVSFEMSIQGDLRRRLYQAMAEIGIGRDTLVFAKKLG